MQLDGMPQQVEDGDVPVARVTVGGRVYSQWSEAIFRHTFGTLPLGITFFMAQHDVDTSSELLSVQASAAVFRRFEHVRSEAIQVLRRTPTCYEVQLEGAWHRVEVQK
jgi:hypothetical protein